MRLALGAALLLLLITAAVVGFRWVAPQRSCDEVREVLASDTVAGRAARLHAENLPERCH